MVVDGKQYSRMPDLVKEVKDLHSKVTEKLEELPKEVPQGQLVAHVDSLIKHFDRQFQ